MLRMHYPPPERIREINTRTYERRNICFGEDQEKFCVHETNNEADHKRRHFNSEIRPTMKQQPNTPRHDYFLAVDQSDVYRVLYKACPAEEVDAIGRGFLSLVSNDNYEGSKLVGVAYIMPSVYSLIEMRGWESLIEDDDEVVGP